MTYLHWMADCLATDEWPDNPATTPEAAAREFLAIGGIDNDDCWEAWDILERQGEVHILVRGWQQTDELIENEDERFEDYEPGQSWFKRTAQVKNVAVSLKFEVTTSPTEKAPSPTT